MAQGVPEHGLGQLERGLEAQGGIQLAVHQGGVQLGGQAGADVQLHPRVRLGEAPQHIGQKAVQRGVQRAQAQLASILLGADVVAQLVQGTQQQLPLGVQALAGPIGADVAALAHQQAAAHVVFQHPHLLGNGRRAELQLARRLRHGATVHDF